MNTGAKVGEVRVSVRAVYIAAFLVGVPGILSLVFLAERLRPGRRGFDPGSLLLALVLLVPVAWIHELLHALAAVTYGRVCRQDVRLRIDWRMGVVSCHIKAPMPVRAARVVGLMPLIALGPLALGLVLVYPHRVTALLAGMTLLGCIMDVVMVGKLRRFDGGLLVVDHPTTEPRLDIYAPDGPTHD
jgi:hypothetical protein